MNHSPGDLNILQRLEVFGSFSILGIEITFSKQLTRNVKEKMHTGCN